MVKKTHLELLKHSFNKIIVPSNYMAYHTRQEGFDQERITLIPNGVEVQAYSLAQEIPLGEPPILWVGYAKPSKGSHIMVGLAKLLGKTLPKA
jgi:glycosyltransferase involved in cell wall biosynthesis